MIARNLFSCILTMALVVVGIATGALAATGADPDLSTLCRQFEEYSGARLVFHRADLPPGEYYDILLPLGASRQEQAAAICLREARKYPPGYFRKMGFKSVGVFAACVSKKGDGFRPYNKKLGGYRYYGVYNGADAIAAAYYSDGQLPLTFHHEIFHHVDCTVDGKTESWQLSSDDIHFDAAISGRQRYAAPTVSDDDLAALSGRRKGQTLRGAVSDYAAKNSREDQAETARHLMSTMPTALVQAIAQPHLAGSQRILHVLREYEQAVPDGPGVDWFVETALARAPNSLDRIAARLKSYADGGRTGYSGVAKDPGGARTTLKALAGFDARTIPPQQAAELVRLSAEVTHGLLKQRMRPDTKQRRFVVWGQEDEAGVNWTLRDDVEQFRSDVARLKRVALLDERQSSVLVRAQMKNLRLIARYYSFIAANWTVTPGTQNVFESARLTLSHSLPPAHASLTKTLCETELRELAWRIAENGQLRRQ